ncbi:protein kinase [Streptomyces sp. NPDC048639]|uniref:protein kinase domain-containing protein n=1 Tax=Streptomyces sp. NPDC048639 TaxID=3365581 RepID=UPI003714E31C
MSGSGGGTPFAVQVPKGYRVGCWEVREPLASGAFGSVYAARRRGTPGPDAPPDLPGSAALKFLPTGTRTPRQLRHLEDLAHRELELHRRLRRPRLIRMYEALTVDDPGNPGLDGATVLVLERAECSLDALLAAAGDGRLPDGPALLAQICEGLAQLHGAGWVHGDLKPGNVLLMPGRADGSRRTGGSRGTGGSRRTGDSHRAGSPRAGSPRAEGGGPRGKGSAERSVRLGDFNLAAELEGTHAYAPAFSTPDYTPPELLWSDIGERGQQIRTTADVWAFGVVAHLVLAGTLPMPGATVAARRDATVRYARGAEDLRLSPELPDGWREIIGDCLARTHQERAAHTSPELLRRIERLSGTGRSPRLPHRLVRTSRPGTGRRPRGLALAVTAAVTAAVVGLGYGLGVLGGGDSSDGDGASEKATAATYGREALRTDAGVPTAYRKLIVEAAHACTQAEVTPPLIAALLKAESDFDPDLSDPAKDEYGIARWTPRVLKFYLPPSQVPDTGDPEPPFPPEVSIPAVGRYLCVIAPRLDADLKGNREVLVAAAYRTSFRKVNEAGGVPAAYRDYAATVERHLEQYTPRTPAP